MWPQAALFFILFPEESKYTIAGMKELSYLFDKNITWAEELVSRDPDYFKKMSREQCPKYLWIGCSDARVPANEIMGLEPGELFVHRNIANLCPHTDFNCLSVLQYGIDYLNIEHVIVCGHYGCGGVAAAMGDRQLGLVDNWLRHVRDVYAHAKEELDAIKDLKKRYDSLAELNVLQQVANVCHTTIVQNAWARKQHLCVHGWMYDISTGKLKDIGCCITGANDIQDIYLTRFLR
jgi:carbonic anhydrase